MILIRLAVSLLLPLSTFAQSPATEQKMSVNDRMAKARAAKMEKRTTTSNGQPAVTAAQSDAKFQKATPDAYKTPVVKSQKGPNGEAVRVGERGGKYYINKNGKRTYLSSNQ